MSYVRAYSTARGGTLIPQLFWLSRYRFQNRDRFAHVKFQSFLRIRHALESTLGRPLIGQSLLEIGCGQYLANVKLFSALGNTVIGIDPELPPQSILEFLDFKRKCGFQRAVKTFIRGCSKNLYKGIRRRVS